MSIVHWLSPPLKGNTDLENITQKSVDYDEEKLKKYALEIIRQYNWELNENVKDKIGDKRDKKDTIHIGLRKYGNERQALIHYREIRNHRLALEETCCQLGVSSPGEIELLQNIIWRYERLEEYFFLKPEEIPLLERLHRKEIERNKEVEQLNKMRDEEKKKLPPLCKMCGKAFFPAKSNSDSICNDCWALLLGQNCDD